MSNTWEKTGRDAADEDIAGGAEPCTTLAEARRRIGQWLRSQTPAVAAAEAETCAAAYLRAWQAHATGNVPPLDLDAIEARYLAASERTGAMPPVWRSASDVPALVARVRDLTAKLGATAQAFDGLVAQVWRATGETHEPPADVGALLARVADDHKALAGFRRAALDINERIDGERIEPDFDMPAEFGAYVCDEVARLQREVAAARREGAEAMRESCASRARDHAVALKAEAADAGRSGRPDAANSYYVAASAAGSIADAIRALRLPGGEPRCDGAEAALRGRYEALVAAVREALRAADELGAASVAERLGHTFADVAAVIARSDAARKAVEAELSKGTEVGA